MITPDLLRSWSACWTDAEIADFVTLVGCSMMSPRAIVKHVRVTLNDRLWVVCHALEHRNPATASVFAIDQAARVSHLAGNKWAQLTHAQLVAELRGTHDPYSWDVTWHAAVRSAEPRLGEFTLASARHSVSRNSAWFSAMHASRVDMSVRGMTWCAATSAVRALSAIDVAAGQRANIESIDSALVALGSDADGWVNNTEAVHS